MPNYCNNRLTISGSKKDVDKVLKTIKGKKTDFDFNKVVPVPPELYEISEPQNTEAEKAQAEQNLKAYGAKSWYDFCRDNWGTKWDVEASADRYCDEEAGITFDSAWCPPCPIITKLGEMFPKVSFDLTYYECGMGFAGSFRVKGKKVVNEEFENGSVQYKEAEESFGFGDIEDKEVK